MSFNKVQTWHVYYMPNRVTKVRLYIVTCKNPRATKRYKETMEQHLPGSCGVGYTCDPSDITLLVDVKPFESAETLLKVYTSHEYIETIAAQSGDQRILDAISRSIVDLKYLNYTNEEIKETMYPKFPVRFHHFIDNHLKDLD